MHSEPYQRYDHWGEPSGKSAQCRCCGDAATFHNQTREEMALVHPSKWRCNRHRDRNPCAVEGCSRTEAANGDLHNGDQWICSVHWKLACPPRSRERRLYHAWHRKGRKFGWPEEMKASYWRFWGRLVAKARKMGAGDIDMQEINRMFGWDKP